jgi:hypothetical protein
MARSRFHSSPQQGILTGADYDCLLDLILVHADTSNGGQYALDEWREYCSAREKWSSEDFTVMAGAALASLIATFGVPAVAASASATLSFAAFTLGPATLITVAFVSLGALTISLTTIAGRIRRSSRNWQRKHEVGRAWIRLMLSC